MKLAGTEFNLLDGTFDIFVSGCYRECKGCFNPEAQDFNFGEELNVEVLIKKIKEHNNLIKSIRIMGGDLLCQDEIIALDFSTVLFKEFPEKDLVLYTGEYKDNIPKWCFELFNAIKYGPYIEELRCDNSIYGSNNQGYATKDVKGNWQFKEEL